jgi:hypothetical protein
MLMLQIVAIPALRVGLSLLLSLFLAMESKKVLDLLNSIKIELTEDCIKELDSLFRLMLNNCSLALKDDVEELKTHVKSLKEVKDLKALEYIYHEAMINCRRIERIPRMMAKDMKRKRGNKNNNSMGIWFGNPKQQPGEL